MSARRLAEPMVPNRDEVVARLEELVRDLPVESLPDLAGDLERVSWKAKLRIQVVQVAPQAAPGPSRAAQEGGLLTAQDVAMRLSISASSVYRMAKAELAAVAVQVGPGQLRFDAARLERFLSSRRRRA